MIKYPSIIWADIVGYINYAKLPSPNVVIRGRTAKAGEPNRNETSSYARIIQAFQNIGYIGELRQRWEEIKKLQSKPAFSASY